MIEVTVGNYEYRIGKLNPFQQLYVAKRLAPVLLALGSVSSLLENVEDDKVAMKAMGPIMESLSKLSDDDCNFIITTCLKVVARKQEDKFAAVIAANGRLMFEDIELKDMMQLTARTVKENLGNFFPAELIQ